MKFALLALWAIMTGLMIYSVESIWLFALTYVAAMLFALMSRRHALSAFKDHLTRLRDHSMQLVTQQAKRIEELERERGI